MLGKFGSRSRCPLGGGRCLQCHRKMSSVAKPVSSAEWLKGRHKNGIRQKYEVGTTNYRHKSKGLVLDRNITQGAYSDTQNDSAFLRWESGLEEVLK